MPLPVFDTEGHRGARGLMPENTIPAMLKAIDQGVTTLEMDVHITADRKVILSHDAHINSLFTLNADGKEISEGEAKSLAFYKMQYAAISQYDVGSKYYKNFPRQQKIKTQIPLLSQLVDSVQNYLAKNNKAQVFYNIETKSKPDGDHIFHPEPETFVKLIMDVIKKKKLTQWVIIQSFDPRTLQAVHEKYQNVRTSLLIENGTLESNLKKLNFLPSIYSPNAKLVTAELVKECHKKNLKIVPWTVNTKKEIEDLKFLGVDGIISDFPDLFYLK
ncbi:MAG: glycerophosphodiester phosphodiesterase [Flavobacterium sp.]|nr:glycerophosphodiester phosphodiesterase [Pedobacter sp.]